VTLAKAEESLGIKNPLPLGWRLVRLGDLCDVNPSRHVGFQRAHDTLTTFVPMSAVDEHRGVILNAEIRPFSEVAKGYTFFNEGDVLFAKITPCMQNGKHAIARGLLDGIGFGSTEFHVIRPRAGVVAEWIHRFIRQHHVLSAATNYFTGAVGQQRVPESFLASLDIPLPSIDEQQRIIRIVNAQIAVVEKARVSSEARLEAAKALPAVYLRQVFPKPGQELPDGWRWVKLKDVCDVVNGFGFPEHLQGRTDLPYPFIKVSDMNAPGSERVVTSAANTVNQEVLNIIGGRVYPCGTVIFPKVGGALLTNKNRILGTTACFDNNVMGVVPKKVANDYVFYWFQTIDLRTLANVQALPSVKQSSVAALELPLPPLSEQKHIKVMLNEQLTAVEKIVQTVQRELETINALSGALLRQAFTGGL